VRKTIGEEEMSHQFQQNMYSYEPTASTGNKQGAAGDQYSFDALVKEYERPLRAYVRNILKDEELVADVLQSVFFQLYVSLPKLTINKPLKAWLFRVSYHRSLDELRKRRRRPVILFSQLERGDGEEEPFFVEMIPDEQLLPESVLEQQELRERLVHALYVLSPKARSIVYLRGFGGLTFSEIGKQLNISETTAKTCFHRALPRLRAVF